MKAIQNLQLSQCIRSQVLPDENSRRFLSGELIVHGCIVDERFSEGTDGNGVIAFKLPIQIEGQCAPRCSFGYKDGLHPLCGTPLGPPTTNRLAPRRTRKVGCRVPLLREQPVVSCSPRELIGVQATK
jgi:hypothetical protein